MQSSQSATLAYGGAVAEEQIDVITPQGAFTGVTKGKSLVHANGDWHACVHFIVTDGQGRVIVQFRGPGVKLMRNVWDMMSIAGHISAVPPGHPRPDWMLQAFAAGEREGMEEIGVTIDPSILFSERCRFIGVTRVDQQTEDGWMDRALNYNFVLVMPGLDPAQFPLEEGKVLAAEWRHVDEIEAALDGVEIHDPMAARLGQVEPAIVRYAVREPDHQWLLRLAIAAVRLIARGH